MSTTYIINIYNKSAKDEIYHLFAELPKVSSEGTDPDVYSNIYKSSKTVFTPHGHTKFEISTDYYAVCGTHGSKKALVGVFVTTGDSTEVTLATETAPGTIAPVAIANDGSPGFKIAGITLGAKAGFQIITDGFIPSEDNIIYVGLGGDDKEKNDVVPLATFPAEPNEIYVITPVVKYFIATGNYKAGQVIDVAAMGKKIAEIDFTGKREHNAKVIHDKTNSYAVAYSLN